VSWAEARRTALIILVVDVVVIGAAIGLSVVLGAFNRSAIGLIILAAGGMAMLFGVVSSSALPLFGSPFGGGMSALNYTNVMHQEMLLQQQVRDAHSPHAERRRKPISSFGLVVIGLSLLVLGFVVAG
jgi:hypothetical protein